MRNLDEHTITQAVLDRFSNTPDPRLKEIIFSLVHHLHDFAREVRLTEDEWLAGIQFLTRAGHITDDKRQEFILISDTLGLSMLTVAMNNHKPEGCTEATVVGPFHVENAPHYNLGDDVGNGAIGDHLLHPVRKGIAPRRKGRRQPLHQRQKPAHSSGASGSSSTFTMP